MVRVISMLLIVVSIVFRMKVKEIILFVLMFSRLVMFMFLV